MRPDFRPMLAAKIQDIKRLRYPLLATPKIDGIRCITREYIQRDIGIPAEWCEAVSRTLTPIPNYHIQSTLGKSGLLGLDGELITFTNGTMDSYNTTQSKVMTGVGTPEFEFMVFDVVEPAPYWDRMSHLKDNIQFPIDSPFKKLLPTLINDERNLLAYEEAMLQSGFEGVMLRNIDGEYKFGRSTFNQHGLLKLKRFEDAEATVIGFQELQHNQNEATIGKLGLTERSDHKANKLAGNTLGALVVNGHNGVTFNIGTGFDEAMRSEIWNNQDKYLMQIVKYKYQPHGQKDAPRCPVFLGFRSASDIGE